MFCIVLYWNYVVGSGFFLVSVRMWLMLRFVSVFMFCLFCGVDILVRKKGMI